MELVDKINSFTRGVIDLNAMVSNDTIDNENLVSIYESLKEMGDNLPKEIDDSKDIALFKAKAYIQVSMLTLKEIKDKLEPKD